jgi:hypothetical protein
MSSYTARSNKTISKASDYFLKMYSELDLQKYKLAKYQELFKMSSFRAMHDADLAYYNVYSRCAENAGSKENLLYCLDQEERFLTQHPEAFDAGTYRMHLLKAINEIREHLKNGSLDHLYF